MFGQNQIVGRKFFDENANDRLLVTSVFHTLQGEGPFAGRPAVFVRLAHCNLACSFCDTFFDHGDWMTRGDLMDRIMQPLVAGKQDSSKTVLVITGGEPMLQKALVPFLMFANSYFDKVQIESNGLQLLEMPTSACLVVSPKCAEAQGKPTNYLQPPKRVMQRANCLKFVVTEDNDSPYNAVPPWALEWRARTDKPIYVSPMAEYKSYPLSAGGSGGNLEERSKAERVSFWQPGLLDLDKVRANHEYAAKYALDHGLYLSLQMQLFASLP
jgi:7-carboxy-7-deazaguanine synthase